jgi:hypothetical protein
MVLPATSTLSYGAFAPTGPTQLLCKNNADFLYVPLGASVSTLAVPTGNFDFNAKQITNLASGGAVVSGSTNAASIGDLYSYVAGLPTNTQQVYSVTLAGSTTTGVTWNGLSANGTSTSYAQCNFVKGNAANKYITATGLSTTGYSLYGNVCHVLLTVQSQNVRVVSVSPHTTAAVAPGNPTRENIGSLSFNTQASTTATSMILELYKPETGYQGDAFQLWLVVDSY